MENNVYTAWDDNQYQGPPPDGWYLAFDNKWWPEGYGPPAEAQEEASDAVDLSSTARVADAPAEAMASRGTDAGEQGLAASNGRRGLIDDLFDGGTDKRVGTVANGLDETTSQGREKVGGVLGGSLGKTAGALGLGGAAAAAAGSGLGSKASDLLKGAKDSAGTVVGDVSSTDLPTVGGPDIDLADSKVAGLDIPDVDLPDLDAPDLDVSGLGTPDVAVPDVAVPDLDVSNREMPDINAPDVNMPSVDTPDVDLPDLDAPDLDVSGLGTPDVAVPDVAVPDLDAPDLDVPDREMPDINAPDVSMPSVDTPGVDMPDLPAGADTATILPTGEIPEGPLAEALGEAPIDLHAPGMDKPTLDIPPVDLEAASRSGVLNEMPLAETEQGTPTREVPSQADHDDVGVNAFHDDVVVHAPHAGGEYAEQQAYAAPGALEAPSAGPSYAIQSPSAAHDQHQYAAAPSAQAQRAPTDDRGRGYYDGGNVDLRSDMPKKSGGRWLALLGGMLVLAAACGLAYLAYDYFTNQSDGEAASVEEDATAAVGPGSAANPHPSTQPVSVFWDIDNEGNKQRWLVKPEPLATEEATALAEAASGDGESYAASRLIVLNQEGSDAAELDQLLFSAVSDSGDIYEAVDCPAGQPLPSGQVALTEQAEGVLCWLVPNDAVDGLMLGIQSTEVPGTIHVLLP